MVELLLKPITERKTFKPVEKPPELYLKPAPKLDIKPFQIKKEEHPITKAEKMQRVIDNIGRLGYGIKSIASEHQQKIVKAQKDIPPEDFAQREKARLSVKHSMSERLNAFWRGATLKEKHTANELLEKVGIKGVPGLGFVVEIYSDPAVIFGAYKAAGVAVKQTVKSTGIGLKALAKPVAGKIVTKAPILGKILPKIKEPIVAGYKQLGVTGKELFITKTKLGELGALIDKHLLRRKYGEAKTYKYGIAVRKGVERTAQKYKLPIRDVQKEIVNLIESPKTTKATTAETQYIADRLKQHFDAQLIREMKAPIKIAGLGSGKEKAVGTLREKLNILRSLKRDQLFSARESLQRDLDDIGRRVVTKAEKGLIGEQKALQQRAITINRAKVGSLNQKLKGIDEKLRIYETQLGQAKLKDLPTKNIENYIERLENEYWYYTGELADRIQDVPELAKGSFATRIKEIEGILSKGEIEINLGRSGLSKAKKLYDVEEKIRAGILPGTKREGALLKKLADIRSTKEMGYFPRVISKGDLSRYLKSASIGGKKIWNTKLSHSMKRKTGDYTLEEVNEFFKQNGIEGLTDSVPEFFSTSPAYATTLRGLKSVKAISSAQFLKDTAKTFGLPTAKAPTSYVDLPENLIRLNPSLKGLKFAPDVADEIGRVTTVYFNPESTGAFKQTFDTIQNLWKKWTLAPFPKYHLRNMVGNTWNIYLEGSTKPKHFNQMQALQMYRKYGKTTGKMKDFSINNLKRTGLTPYQADAIIVDFEKHGVLGHGWFAADIDEGIKQELQKGLIGHPARLQAKKIFTGEIITEKGMAFGTTIENNARGALGLARLEQGDDILKASQTVKKYLFDYGDLTDFEKQIMKRIFPFYTWTRKNIPLQLETLLTKPEKFAPLVTALRGRDPLDLLRLKYARPDYYERLPIEIRRTAETVTYVPLEGLIPAGDLVKMVRPHELLLEMLSPFLKSPMELAFGKSLYFESEIQKYDKETQELLRMDIPVNVKYALTTVLPQSRLINEINKLVRKQTRKEKLTPAEQAFSQSLSSIYKTSIKDLRKRALFSLKKKQDELIRGLYRAKYFKRPKEEERIRKTLKELQKQRKEIK